MDREAASQAVVPHSDRNDSKKLDKLLRRAHTTDPLLQAEILAQAKGIMFGAPPGKTDSHIDAIARNLFPLLLPDVLIDEVFQSEVDDRHMQEWRREYKDDHEFLHRHLPVCWDAYHAKLLLTAKEYVWSEDPRYAKALVASLKDRISRGVDSYMLGTMVRSVNALTILYPGDVSYSVLFPEDSRAAIENRAVLTGRAHELFDSLAEDPSTPYMLSLYFRQREDDMRAAFDSSSSQFTERDDGFERWDSAVTPFVLAPGMLAVNAMVGGYVAVLAIEGEKAEMVEKLIDEKENLRAEFEDIRSQKQRVLYGYDAQGDVTRIPQEVYDWYRTRTPVEERMYELERAITDEFFLITDSNPWMLTPREERMVDFDAYAIDIPDANGEYWASFFSPEIRRRIKIETGIDLAARPIRDQMYFLAFGLKAESAQAPRIKSLLASFGEGALSTFLATALDVHAGNEILKLGEWAGENEERIRKVKKIFAKFCELSATLDSLGRFMKETFNKSDPEIVGAMSKTTLERARKIIGDAYAAIQTGGEKALASVLRSLETSDTAMRRFLDGCQQLKKQGALDPEGILGAQLVPRYGSEFAKDETTQREIIGILRSRYADRPESFRIEVEKALRIAMESSDSLFYLYYLPDSSGNRRLAGLFRLDEKKVDGRVIERHFASMFLNPLFEKGGLMSTLAQSVLAKASADAPVAAECFITGAPITSEYLSWGFVATSESRSLGMQLLNITLDPGCFSSLKTRGKLPNRETIMRAADEGGPVAYPGSDVVFYGADVPPNFQQEYFEKGFMMTHYFQAASNGRYYALFERPRR